MRPSICCSIFGPGQHSDIIIGSAIFVKPQQWPTPSESIAIYCIRKLVSCITHLQSCAKVDIWNKKKKLRTVAKIKTQVWIIRFNVTLNHQIQCNIPTSEALLRKNVYSLLERCRKSNNVWLRALMQSDCLYSSLFFERYNRILLCDWVLGHCSVCSFEGVSCHNAFVLYLASTTLGISVLLCSSVVPKCYGLANNTVKNVSVTLWLGLQRRCKTFCKVSVCNRINQPPMPFKNVLFCTFKSTCVVQKECVCTMDFVSAGKNTCIHFQI